jgi:uncharacterized protein YndB with AHSA1/START domain
MTDKFLYVTYIRTTPDKLWDALLKPEFQRQWFYGTTLQSDWKKGNAWKMIKGDGSLDTVGKIVDIDKGKRLVMTWANESMPELKAEGASQVSFDLEQKGDLVKLTVLHEIAREGSKLIEKVGGGWPMVLSNLKTFLETGAALSDPRAPGSCAA